MYQFSNINQKPQKWMFCVREAEKVHWDGQYKVFTMLFCLESQRVLCSVLRFQSLVGLSSADIVPHPTNKRKKCSCLVHFAWLWIAEWHWFYLLQTFHNLWNANYPKCPLAESLLQCVISLLFRWSYTQSMSIIRCHIWTNNKPSPTQLVDKIATIGTIKHQAYCSSELELSHEKKCFKCQSQQALALERSVAWYSLFMCHHSAWNISILSIYTFHTFAWICQCVLA